MARARAKDIREAWAEVAQSTWDLVRSYLAVPVQYFTKSSSQRRFLLHSRIHPSFPIPTSSSCSCIFHPCSYHTAHKSRNDQNANASNQDPHHQPQHQPINDRLPPRTHRKPRLQQRTFPLPLPPSLQSITHPIKPYPTTPLLIFSPPPSPPPPQVSNLQPNISSPDTIHLPHLPLHPRRHPLHQQPPRRRPLSHPHPPFHPALYPFPRRLPHSMLQSAPADPALGAAHRGTETGAGDL